MDKANLDFIERHKDKLQGRVIEIGSFNVNGSVRSVIEVEVGVDLRKGPGVDLVCPVERLHEHYGPGTFDACVSTNTLEHVEDWKGFVLSTWDLVTEGGWLVMTMASMAKGRHDYPGDYWRFTEEQIKAIWPNAEYEECGNVSIAWVVRKEGSLGNLDAVCPRAIV